MNRKPRVMMISKAAIVGIYQRKMELIAEQGIDLLTIVPPSWRDKRGEMPLEQAFTNGYALESLPVYLNGRYHLHVYRGLGRRLREFQPDIVHIDEEPYSAVTWQILWHAKRLKCKTLFFSWQNINRTYPPPFRWGEQWVLKQVDYAIVGTASAGDVWREKGYTGDIAVIPQFGTDPRLFTPSTTRPARPFTIGYVGRLVEEKGLDTLLEAVAQLPFEWRLKLLGGGPLRDPLQHQAEVLGVSEYITFEGQIPSTEVPVYYSKLDVLVLPSRTRPNWKEQFGRVIVEAMASGVPVIGSDSGAIPDVIGGAGLVFPEGEVTALVERITQLYNSPELYAELRQKGRQRFLEHFTHQQIAQATVQVYNTLLK